MRVRMILVLVVFLIITSGAVFCQNTGRSSVGGESTTETLLSGELFTPAVAVDIATYFNYDWLPGDIFLTDGRVVRNQNIRYNGLLDELFWLEPKSNLSILLDKEAINQFHFLNFLGDTTVYFRKLIVKRDILNDSIDIFGQQLFAGNLSLFVFHSFYFLKAQAVAVEKRLILKDVYREDPVYYIKFPDNRVIGFKRFNRKNVYAIMPDKEDEIRKFFREKQTGKFQTNQEIIWLVQFLNSISGK